MGTVGTVRPSSRSNGPHGLTVRWSHSLTVARSYGLTFRAGAHTVFDMEAGGNNAGSRKPSPDAEQAWASRQGMRQGTIEHPNTGWWARNWKWAVPTGCLGALALFAAFIAAIVSLVFGIMKSSDAYKEALAKAEASPAVREALGQPVKAGLLITGRINVNGPSGQAHLAIPISGPKGKGTLFADAEKSAGRWKYSTLAVELHGTGQRVDLLEKGNPDPPVERAR